MREFIIKRIKESNRHNYYRMKLACSNASLIAIIWMVLSISVVRFFVSIHPYSFRNLFRDIACSKCAYPKPMFNQQTLKDSRQCKYGMVSRYDIYGGAPWGQDGLLFK